MFQKLLPLRFFRKSPPISSRKDYYSSSHTGILGVSRTSSDQDIKKAYFSLAKQYHPDVNKATDAKQRFSDIAEAYDTLSNGEKRKMYDATGMTGDEQEQARASGADFGGGFNPFGGGFQGQGGQGGQDFGGYGSFQDIMNEFEEIFGGGGGARGSRKAYKGEDILMNLTIGFLDAAKGSKTKVTVDRKAVCATCHGTKVKPGTSPTKCTQCGGRGVVFFQRGPMSVQTPCTKCKGSGTSIRHPCPSCSGSGVSQSQSTETINIPAGVDTGSTLRMAGKGHHAEGGGPAGDLLVKVTVQPHPSFRREGYDLYADVAVPVSKAALGGAVVVETLEGKLTLRIEPGDDLGAPRRISGKGIQHLPPEFTRRGDLYVTIQVQIPKSLSNKQRMLFEELRKEDTNEVTPESFSSRSSSKKAK